ncbi:MAG: hypothetical protein ACFFDD_06115 [Promethearchaeota archaeon]
MTENPDEVIEEYLALVNEHLPESISEDVITELRTYMIETARDLGAGEITLQSAKRVVAQFGAPSEVADEYKFSMLPETIPDVPSNHEPSQRAKKEPEEKHEEPEPRKDPTVSYTKAALQGVSITIFCSILVILASTLLGPVWLTPDSLVVFLIQITFVVLGIAVLVYYRKHEKTILWKRSYPEWSFTQRFLTLPENMFKEISDSYLVVDIFGALTGVGLFFLSSLFSSSPYYLPVIGIPAIIALFAKAFYAGKRLGPLNPLMNIKAEVLSTFAALALMNSSQVWFAFFSQAAIEFPFLIPFRIYTIVWGSVLLSQLVARVDDLWWDSDESDTDVATVEIEVLIQRTSNFAGITLLRLVGWIILFSVIPTYCLMIAENIGTLWFAPLWIAFFFGPVFLSPVIVYYLYRRWRLKKRTSKSVIGKRSKLEAVGDLILSVYLLGGFITDILIWTTPDQLFELYNLLFFDLGDLGTLYYLIGFMSSNLLLLAGLVVRLIGNSLEFGSKQRNAAEVMVASGKILITAISLRVGIDILSDNFISSHIILSDTILFPFILYPVILLLIITIAFQVETSRLKLKENQKTTPDISEFQSNRREIKDDIENPKLNQQFPGN